MKVMLYINVIENLYFFSMNNKVGKFLVVVN